MIKKLILLLILFLITSCGNSGSGGVHYPTDELGKNGLDNFTPVAQAIVKVSQKEEYAYQYIFRKLNPISVAYAVSTTATVTYVASEVGSIAIDTTGIVPTENGDTLELGSITITDLKANKLKVCGVSNNEKCTTAVVRIYTQELVGFEGLSGFVNTTDGYGVGVFSGKSVASDLVGLSSLNSAILQSYTILASDRRISLSDFPTPTYLLESDFSNAGAGNYEMTIVVELALGI